MMRFGTCSLAALWYFGAIDLDNLLLDDSSSGA
jgi:hypothetical protein